jgi:hypothetical protein
MFKEIRDMKIFKLTYGLMAAAMLSFTSCNINEYPEFDDSDAFLAFTSSTASIGEEQGSIEIPLLLTSTSGLSASAEVEVVPDETGKGAVEGTDFTIVNKTLSFSGLDGATQKVKINIIDNDVFGGNKSFVLRLKDGGNVKLGAAKTCTVTIQDNEHPLAFILGTYGASADSYFSSRGHFDWDITISRDESDVNKVWIGDLDPYFAVNGINAASGKNIFYGVVNAEKTQILVPAGQKLGYQNTELAAFVAADPDQDETEAENVIIDIQNGGQTLVITNAWGIYDDGWWNLFRGPITLTKK